MQNTCHFQQNDELQKPDEAKEFLSSHDKSAEKSQTSPPIIGNGAIKPDTKQKQLTKTTNYETEAEQITKNFTNESNKVMLRNNIIGAKEDSTESACNDQEAFHVETTSHHKSDILYQNVTTSESLTALPMLEDNESTNITGPEHVEQESKCNIELELIQPDCERNEKRIGGHGGIEDPLSGDKQDEKGNNKMVGTQQKI